MRRPRRPVPARVRGFVLCALVLVAGCSSDTVSLPAPDGSPPGLAACPAVVEALPDTLAGQERRTVGGDGQGAAWGDPAIVVTCGAAMSAEFDEFSSCDIADGVAWFAPPSQSTDQSADAVLTTVGYEPTVSVLVPADYRPGGVAAALTELAPALKRTLVEVDPC